MAQRENYCKIKCSRKMKIVAKGQHVSCTDKTIVNHDKETNVIHRRQHVRSMTHTHFLGHSTFEPQGREMPRKTKQASCCCQRNLPNRCQPTLVVVGHGHGRNGALYITNCSKATRVAQRVCGSEPPKPQWTRCRAMLRRSTPNKTAHAFTQARRGFLWVNARHNGTVAAHSALQARHGHR